MTAQSETKSRLVAGALYLTIIAGLFLGIGLAGTLVGCSTPDASADGHDVTAAARLTTAKVALHAIADTAIVTGTVTADRSSAVAADAPGKVTAVYVERGDRVAQGQPLVRLDVRSAVLSAREARAQRAAVDSEAQLASIERARSQALFDKGAITRAEYDREISAHASTREQAEAAAARLSLANKAVGDGLVRAPYAGVVVERMVQVGEYVRADTQLVSLVDPDPLRLELTVPESQIGRLAVGRRVSFTTNGLPGRTFGARIDVLGPALDRAGRSLVVEAIVDSAPASADGAAGLLPGMFVTAHIEIGRRQLPVVPRVALRRAGSTWRLFAVVNGSLEERIVQLAEPTGPEGEQVALLVGAKAGDRVVTPADEKLRDGMRVE